MASSTMRAATILEPHRLEMQELRVPEAGPGEVRVRVAATGVCGTDLHLYGGHFDPVFPLTPGHEIAGVVDQVGANVRGLREGMRVALDPVIACGVCHHCRRGMRHHCEHYQALGVTRAGGFAEYVVAPEGNAYPVGDMDLEVAAFAEPLGCVAWGIKRLRPEPASKALLFGAGPIGLLLMQALLASGAAEVTVVEPNATRRLLAKELGAKLALEPHAGLGTELRDLEPYGFDIVTEATGAPKVIAALPQYAAPGGKILYYGVAPDDARVEISPYDVFRRDLTILGSFSLLGTVPEALAWLSSGRVRVKPIISHRLPIEDLRLALEYKDHPGMNGSQKVLIVP
jgi:2-desacetyl-2-hydroxyethyl bacteriochlorophyllide A dehydrogenase